MDTHVCLTSKVQQVSCSICSTPRP